MTAPIQRTRSAMVANMEPILRPGAWVFLSLPAGEEPPADLEPIALFREAEGWSLVVDARAAQAAGYSADAHYRQITLTVFSALDGVGLTAAVAGALAEAGIACNMIAAFYHDHLFVPAGDAERAVRRTGGPGRR